MNSQKLLRKFFLLVFVVCTLCAAQDPLSSDYNKYLRFHWKGAVSSHSIIFKIFPNSQELEASQYYTFLVAYTKSAGLLGNIRVNQILFPEDSFPVAVETLGNLTPKTRYFYTFIFSTSSSLNTQDFEDYYNPIQDTILEFSFSTFNVAFQPHSFTFGAASCAKTSSDHPVFGTLHDQDFDFFIHMGDFHYEDIGRNDPEAFYNAYYNVFSIPIQKKFYESTPIFYLFDDHDFGENDATGTSVSKPAATAAFKKFVPYTPLKNYLPEDDAGSVPGATPGDTNPLNYLTYNQMEYGIFRSFIVGRCLFIIMDLRSFQDVLPEDILGEEQKNWLENQIRYAGLNSGIKQVVLISSVPWINDDGGILKETSNWDDYRPSQEMIRDLIQSYLTEHGKKVILIAGDAHMLALDDGRNNAYGGFPVAQAASLDRKGSCKGGPYSHGGAPGNNQFGRFEVTDDGGDQVCFKIYLKQGEENFRIYDTCNPEQYPATPFKCPISWRGWLFLVGTCLGGLLIIAGVTYVVIRVVRKRRRQRNSQGKGGKAGLSKEPQEGESGIGTKFAKEAEMKDRLDSEGDKREEGEKANLMKEEADEKNGTQGIRNMKSAEEDSGANKDQGESEKSVNVSLMNKKLS